MKQQRSHFLPIGMFERAKQCLEFLINKSGLHINHRIKFASLYWPIDLCIERLFRTFKIRKIKNLKFFPKNYLAEECVHASNDLGNSASQCLAAEWLKRDTQFLQFFANLFGGCLRIALSKILEVLLGKFTFIYKKKMTD